MGYIIHKVPMPCPQFIIGEAGERGVPAHAPIQAATNTGASGLAPLIAAIGRAVHCFAGAYSGTGCGATVMFRASRHSPATRAIGATGVVSSVRHEYCGRARRSVCRYLAAAREWWRV